MNVQEKVFPGDHCSCGGRVMRFLLESRMPQNDRGDEICCIQVKDICEDCGYEFKCSKLAVGPSPELETIFRAWQRVITDRGELDSAIESEISARKLCREKQG